MSDIEVAYIQWRDAHGGQGQYELKYAQKSEMDEMYTAGIMVAENDDCITVVQDRFKASDEPMQVRCFETIPKVNIKVMRKWRPKGVA